MKKFRCNKCGKYLGEMEKGKILKDTVLYCSDCNNAIKMLEISKGMNYNQNNSEDNGFEKIFGDLFNKKI